MEEKNDVEIFRQLVIFRHFQYQIFLKIHGYNIDEEKLKSDELDIDTNLLGIKIVKNSPLSLRDLEELRISLGLADPIEKIEENLKKAIMNINHTILRMRAENNHARPHFHIEYKKEYKASYVIDTLERIAGSMPKRYEKPILEWASTRKEKLLEIWDGLKAGKSSKYIDNLIYEAQ